MNWVQNISPYITNVTWGMVWFYAIWEILNVIMLLEIEVFNPNDWYVCVISMWIEIVKNITQGWTLPTCLGENICWIQQDLIISCALLVDEWSKRFWKWLLVTQNETKKIKLKLNKTMQRDMNTKYNNEYMLNHLF